MTISKKRRKELNEIVVNWFGLKEKQHKLRKSHYKFAHHALKNYVFENPKQFIKIMKSLNACKILNNYYNNIRATCNDELNITVTEKDFSVHITDEKKYLTIIIAMPETILPPEAKMVGIVFFNRKKFWNIYRNYQIRYFTLEHHESLIDQEPYTVIGEWQGLYENRKHLNYGEGPEPDINKFKNKIDEFFK